MTTTTERIVHEHVDQRCLENGEYAQYLFEEARRMNAGEYPQPLVDALCQKWHGDSRFNIYERGFDSLPALPAVVAAYIADRAGRLKPRTLGVHCAAIGYAHELAKHPNPVQSVEVREILEGLRRVHGAPPVKKAPLLVGDIRAIAGRLPEGIRADRDRAVVLLGFCGGFRRHELVDLDREHLTFGPDGVVALLPRSKTDQVAEGKTKSIGYGESNVTCPVTALRRWLSVAGIISGPVFRAVDRNGRVRAKRLSAKAVASIVKRLASQLGLDPAKLGGHSLRSGFCTSADAAGVSEREIAAVTGHQSLPVLRGYIQQNESFRSQIVRRLGL
jgi:integrase